MLRRLCYACEAEESIAEKTNSGDLLVSPQVIERRATLALLHRPFEEEPGLPDVSPG